MCGLSPLFFPVATKRQRQTETRFKGCKASKKLVQPKRKEETEKSQKRNKNNDVI